MAYVQHRTPCCRSIWESKHNKKDQPVGIPNNIIKYTASEKLAEISNGYNGGGIDTRMFDVSIVNHTFENGIGTIEFDGDITIIKNGSSGPPMGAFYNCSNLTTVTLPNSVISIGSYTFKGCTGLTEVTIPNSVTSIGDGAFFRCTGLTSITIGNSVTTISNQAFNGCIRLTSIEVESGNTKYDSRDNCNAIIETSTNILVRGCKNTVIPDSVTFIGDYAFSGCIGLIKVIIPNNVISIGNFTFQGCTELTEVIIGNSVTTIGSAAFYGCTELISITSLATTAPTIQNNTFRNVKTDGILTVPSGSTGYDTWMQNANYYLGLYNWTKVEQ